MSKKTLGYNSKTPTYKTPEHVRICKYCLGEIYNQMDHLLCQPKLNKDTSHS